MIKCANSKIVSVDSLVPHPLNPNKHPDKQIKLLAKIIKHQGQRLPIVVSKLSGFIVAGHGRLEAIKSLGWKECAIDEQDFASQAEEYAHMIADNKIAEIAEHDDAKMIADLKAMDFDLDLELLGMPDFTIDPTETELPDLSSKEPGFQQVTFVLSNEQKDILDEGLDKAKKNEDCSDDLNQNKNGNILAAIVKRYVYG